MFLADDQKAQTSQIVTFTRFRFRSWERRVKVLLLFALVVREKTERECGFNHRLCVCRYTCQKSSGMLAARKLEASHKFWLRKYEAFEGFRKFQ